jgi:hypothetical protein
MAINGRTNQSHSSIHSLLRALNRVLSKAASHYQSQRALVGLALVCYYDQRCIICQIAADNDRSSLSPFPSCPSM